MKIPEMSRRDHNKRHSPRGPAEESTVPEEEKKEIKWEKRKETPVSQPCPKKDCGGTMTNKGQYMECGTCGLRSRIN